MSKKRIINRGPYIRNGGNVGKKIPIVKSASGKKNFRASILQERGGPSPKLSKEITKKPAQKTPTVARMSFNYSLKGQAQKSQPAKVKVSPARSKGLEHFKGKIEKSAPTKTQPTKTIKRKPPAKGR